MRSVLIAAAAGMLLLGVGCNNNKSTSGSGGASTRSSQNMSTAQDDCAMCPGIQKASADGKCAKCAQKVKG